MTSRSLLRTLTAAVAVAVVALLPPPGAGAATRTPNAVLLHSYQPVLVFHPAEPFRPAKVQSFIGNSVRERFVGTSLAQLPYDPFWTVVDADPEPGELPPPTPGASYRLDEANCEADAALGGRDCYADAASVGSGGAAVYGRVVRTESHVVLQYWLFYYDNPLVLPPTPFGSFWQSHEGDWELVNVVLSANEEPLEAAYSQHCSGHRMAWAGVQKSPSESTHPVAYVALGSHANYFGPGAGPFGEVAINPSCVPAAVRQALPALPFLHVTDQVVDGFAVGAVVGPPGSGVESATIHRIDGTAWSSFGGRWGESEYFYTPIPIGPVPGGTALPVGLAPASPAAHTTWNIDSVLDWPAAP